MEIETAEAIESVRADVRRVEGALTSTREELKSHTLMLFETLRDDIRIVAEGVVALGSKARSIQGNVASLDGKVTSLDAKVGSLDEKITSLDVKVTSLDAKVASVDAKIQSLHGPPDRS